jgi:hypothetical protein
MKLVICASILALCVSVASCSDSDKKNSDDTKATVKTSTIPAPTYQETDDTKKIPNPCEVISIEHVASVLTSATIRGPLVQSTTALSKTCEWSTKDKTFPRLGVSIILSPTFYDGSEAEKIDTAKVGDKAFIVKNFVTAIGGTACGKTIMVTSGDYTFSVAACLKDNKKPSTHDLEHWAKDVINSLQ